MNENKSESYDLLRYVWYSLILALFYVFNRFYQFYYNSTSQFIYFDLIKHYAKKNFSEYPPHFVISLILFALLASVIVFINPFQTLYEQNRIHGSARFAKRKDIKKLGLFKAKGTVLCKWNSKILYVSDPLSILLLAPPGTGKSAGIAIPTLFLNPHSIIALDVKKELFQITSKHRHTFSHVMLFEPTSDTTSCWNPLDKSVLPDSLAEIYVRVQQIASNIFIKSESTSDPYWIDSARELFINIAMALIQRDGGTSIPLVYEGTLGDGNIPRKDSVADLGETEGLYDPVAKKLSAYRHTADQQFSGTLGTFDTGLMGFQDPRVKAAVSKCDIKFKDLRGIKGPDGIFKPVTLYLVIKPVDVERLSPLIRVFFESLSKYLLSTEWNKSTEHMITFLLDEFPRLGKMEDIIKMPALSRGQGVNSILIAQDAGQIERVYSKSGREEIMSTTAYKVIPSQNSFESARLISDSIGDMTIKSNSSSQSNTDFLRSNISKREQAKKLLSPQKIMSLKFGKCYIISQFAAETPINGKLYLWFKDKKLLKIAGELPENLIFRPDTMVSTDPKGITKKGYTLPSQEVLDEYYNNHSFKASEDTSSDLDLSSSESSKSVLTDETPVCPPAEAESSSVPDIVSEDDQDFSASALISPQSINHNSMEVINGDISVSSESAEFTDEDDQESEASFSQDQDVSQKIIEDSIFI